MTDPEGIMRLLVGLRGAGIADKRVMEAMERTDRRVFVNDTFQHRAWDDTALPIACGQTISQPSVVAVMTEALDIGPRDKVLEIGTGSGYQTAILSRLARRVYTVERHKTLIQKAENRLNELGLSNVTTFHGDGALGLPAHAPFDRILLTAAAEDPPPQLIAQLRIGGAMVLPVGIADNIQRLIRIRKTAEGLEYDEIMDVRFVPLIEGVERN